MPDLFEKAWGGERPSPINHTFLTEWPEGSGQLWIHEHHLSEAGYVLDYVGLDTVILVKGPGGSDIYFEVAGTAGTTPYGQRRPGWWIKRIPDPEELFRDLPVLEPNGAKEA